MGLDNMPMVYPCEGIAIKDSDGRTDCVATAQCGNCGWKNAIESDPLVKDLKPVLGIFGADCWYRGKYGNYLLSVLEDKEDTYNDDATWTFYGNGHINGDEGIDSDDCISMSEFMKDNAELFAYKAGTKYPDQSKELISDWIYASWWLNFVGEKCKGSAIWY